MPPIRLPAIGAGSTSNGFVYHSRTTILDALRATGLFYDDTLPYLMRYAQIYRVAV